MPTNLTHSSSSARSPRPTSRAARLVNMVFALPRALFAVWVWLTPHYEDRWNQELPPAGREEEEP